MSKVKAQEERFNKKITRLESVIRRSFSTSHMSNSKWAKLLKAVAAFEEASYPISYKLVNDGQIKSSRTEPYEEHVDLHWFIEPLIYKELEWLEFTSEDNDNLGELVEHLSSVGKFPLVKTSTGYRVIGYS